MLIVPPVPSALNASTSTIEIIDTLLRYASDLGASDLHLDPGEDGVEVRVRCDGALFPVTVLDTGLGATLVGRVKAMSDLPPFRKDVPQEGSILPAISGLAAPVRVATYPTLFGERIAFRLDCDRGCHRSLTALGLDEPVREALVNSLEQPNGVVLVAGPSGCGKTTTLYSCLQHLVSQPLLRTVLTIEDPIERRVRGVTQTQVDPLAGLTFARALRSVLRQDPDVILVGEVRDIETARVVMEAGLTGHLVASTVHAANAVQTLPRLLEMGIEPFVVTSALRGVMSQRLLRRKCPEAGCGAGPTICVRCNGSGYLGQCLVSEWLPMSVALRDAILAHGDQSLLSDVARRNGFRSMRDEAEKLVGDGVTTHEEVRRMLGDA